MMLTQMLLTRRLEASIKDNDLLISSLRTQLDTKEEKIQELIRRIEAQLNPIGPVLPTTPVSVSPPIPPPAPTAVVESPIPSDVPIPKLEKTRSLAVANLPFIRYHKNAGRTNHEILGLLGFNPTEYKSQNVTSFLSKHKDKT